ncbi:MAG: hypothetical protein H7343_05595 [Undibacterium sp.]|nr:hypothetical protein [Opitutaceae bacterium]
MKTETRAWNHLQRHAASQLNPGFADRVLRAARAGAEAAPSLLSIFALSAATAVLCFAAVTLYSASSRDSAERDSIAGWQRIAADSDDFAVN